MDPILKKQLERDEGRRLTAYQDTRGFWTIGVGHLLGLHCRMTVITDSECDALLEADIQVASDSLDRVLPGWQKRDDGRCRALINVMFNRGEAHMRESTTITPAIKAALLGTGKWVQVSDAIKVSPWAVQIGARASRLAEQLATGLDQ